MQPFSFKESEKMYPVMLNLKHKKILIVGGGKVATQKINKLLEQKANITVVSPTLTETLHKYVSNRQIDWIDRSFKQEDTTEAFLVIAATNNRSVNDLVKRSCSQGQLVNVADEPKSSDFYNMAVLDRGGLKIAISTEGASPTLVKKIKQDLAEIFDDSYENYLKFLLEARKIIKEVIQDKERKSYFFTEMMDDLYRKNEVERDYFLENIK